MSNTAKLTMLWTLVLVFISSFVYGQVPQLINYQGRLTDNLGGPVTDSGYVVTFRIWDDSAIGANILWEEEDTISTNNGLFTLFLGKHSSLPDSVFDGVNRYLGIQISGQGEIYPRTQFTSVPYVYRVSTVDGASGGNISGNVEIDGHVGIGTEPLESYVLSISRGSTDIGGLVNIIDSSLGASVYIEKIDDGPGLWISNKGSDGIGIYNDIEAGVGLSIIQKGSSPALDIREDTTGGAGILLTVESDGDVGIGNHPSEKLEVSGIIYSNTGGFRFPDGSIQSTAMSNEYPQWIVNDSVLYTRNYLGIARGGAGNILFGDSSHTHVNLGVFSTTGTDGEDNPYNTISGGYQNHALGIRSTVGGGYQNYCTGNNGTIGGGVANSSTNTSTTVSGGAFNDASGPYSSIGGGNVNSASGFLSTISGGEHNVAAGTNSSILGGDSCTVSGNRSTISGGYFNTVIGSNSVIGGGSENLIENSYSSILGGFADTITSSYSYLFGINSNLSEDSTFMVDMPHIRFGDEIDGYEFPESDGDSGQVMATDGNGQLSWANITNGNGTSGIIPIGAVTAWLKSFPNTPALPDNFVECNGQTINDTDSPFDGQVIPDINSNNRFLRGNLSSGGTGGNMSHSHTISNPTTGFVASALGWGNGHMAYPASGLVDLPATQNTGYQSNEPPYYDVVWIMRIK